MGWILKLGKCPSAYGMTEHDTLGQQRRSKSKGSWVAHLQKHVPSLEDLWDVRF